MIELYAIRSERDRQVRPGDGDLERSSYGCAERADVALFVWWARERHIAAWQLVFAEQFVEWDQGRGLSAGVTDRPGPQRLDEPPANARGVRTLQRSGDDARLLKQAADLLGDARLPIELEPVRRTLVVHR